MRHNRLRLGSLHDLCVRAAAVNSQYRDMCLSLPRSIYRLRVSNIRVESFWTDHGLKVPWQCCLVDTLQAYMSVFECWLNGLGMVTVSGLAECWGTGM